MEKMKYKVHALAALLLLCVGGVTSCSDLDALSKAEKGNTVIKAYIEQAVITRTSVDENDKDGETGICWSPADSIGVYSQSDQNALFISQNIVNAGEAEFSGTLQGSPLYAYYPYKKENNGVSLNQVKGEIPIVQTYSSTERRLQCDHKVGTPKDGNHTEFTFTHLFSLLRLTVNATGIDDLKGENLESVQLSFPEETNTGGQFTTDLATGNITWTERYGNVMRLEWTDRPALGSQNILGYITCAPLDGISTRSVTVSVWTTHYIATFDATLNTDFRSNTIYTVPLMLSEWKEKEDANWKLTERPQISSITFAANSNRGKILDKKLVYSEKLIWGGSTTCTANAGYTFKTDGNSIKGCIPYLYDYKLVPELTYTDGATIAVSTDGNVFTPYDGKTEIDFSNPIQLRVSKDGCSQDYDVSVTNTGLPIMVINQQGGTVAWKETGFNVSAKTADFDEIMSQGGTITVYKADGTIDLENQKAAVRLRGNSTQNYPKKPFAIKLDKKGDILGIMEGKKHKRWVLLANWKDRTLMRNAVAFDLVHIFQQTLTDGLLWNPRGKHIEVVYNGVHIGNYYLCEQIKIDKNRLDIQDPYEIKNGAVDDASLAKYGYLLEADDYYDEDVKFTTKHYLPFMFKDDTDAGGKIRDYVRDKVQGIETRLYNGEYSAAYENLDLPSVIDYWLFMELVMNDEMKHPKSVYMYIDGLDKLHAGPVWDFDWQSFPVIDKITSKYNSSFPLKYGESLLGGGDYTKSYWKKDGTPDRPYSVDQKTEDDTPFMWYPFLFKDPVFRQQAAERWQKVKGSIEAYAPKITEMGEQLASSWKYNDEMWPINSKVGHKELREKNGYAGDEEMDFETAYRTMYETLLKRINGMSFIEQQKLPDIQVIEQ